jgi:hypothetical protein
MMIPLDVAAEEALFSIILLSIDMSSGSLLLMSEEEELADDSYY